MSSADGDELDGFRAELLRQRIIFEAELRRQRETFEERLNSVTQELADREADCRNLQAVVTILGKKIDILADLQQLQRRLATPRRAPTPTRSGAIPDSPVRSMLDRDDGSLSAFHTDPQSSAQRANGASRNFARRPSPLISSAPSPATLSLKRVPSLHKLSRASSPSCIPTSCTASTSRGKMASDGSLIVNSESGASVIHNGRTAASPNHGTPRVRTVSPRCSPNRRVANGGGAHPRRPSLTSLTSGAQSGRRSVSSNSRRRPISAHRLNDVKASDDW